MRRTVLFPPSTAWPSPAAFFASCRMRLLQAYGIPANVSVREPDHLTARCKLTKRSSRSCKFRVDAVLLNGVCVLDEEKCLWEHSHYAGEEQVAGGEEDEAYSLTGESAAMPRMRKKGPMPPLEEPLSAGDDAGSGSDSRNQRDASSDEEAEKGKKLRRSRRAVQFVTIPAQQAQQAPPLVPGLPLPGDRFSSFKAFYQAAMGALVPIYGCGVLQTALQSDRGALKCQYSVKTGSSFSYPCRFRLRAQLDPATDEFVVVGAKSQYAHSHGPVPQILQNPSWRPNVLNNDARSALSMPLSIGQKPKKLLTSGKENNGDLKMLKVLPLPPTPRRPGLRSTTRARAPPFPSFAKPAFRQAVFPPRLPSARLTKDYGVRKKSIVVKPDTASDSSSSPSSPPSSETASPSDGAPLIPAPPPRSFQPTHLTAFFTALHPALALLGPIHFAAGFSTLNSLVDLVLFDSRTVEELLGVRGKSGEGCGVEKPEVRRRWAQLVVEGLKAAREET
ncbi:hypothetical protein JCM8097_003824 [Rhodosporidiobolus ruineniae]